MRTQPVEDLPDDGDGELFPLAAVGLASSSHSAATCTPVSLVGSVGQEAGSRRPQLGFPPTSSRERNARPMIGGLSAAAASSSTRPPPTSKSLRVASSVHQVAHPLPDRLVTGSQ